MNPLTSKRRNYDVDPNWLSRSPDCAEQFLDSEARVLVTGSSLIQACSGLDVAPTLKMFAALVDEIHFIDLCTYSRRRLPALFAGAVEGAELLPHHNPRLPPVSSHSSENKNAKPPNHCYTETHLRAGRSPLRIHRHAACSIDLMQVEVKDSSLAVFMHNSDGMFEGGSNLHFFRMPGDASKVGWFPLVDARLQQEALIISDGSSTNFSHLQKYFGKAISGEQAWQSWQGQSIEAAGRLWRCCGWMAYRNGPTLIWHTSRL